MKRSVLFIAVCLAFAGTVDAQLKVKPSGYTMLGDNYIEDGEDYFMVTGNRDTTTMLKIYGPGVRGSKARMSFGDQYFRTDRHVLVGEAGDADTDMLWLHGMNGLVVTANPTGGDTVLSFAYNDEDEDPSVEFGYPLRAPGVVLQSDLRFKKDVQPLDDALGAVNALTSVSYLLRGHADEKAADLAKADIPDDPTGKAQRDRERFERFYAAQKGMRQYGFIAQDVEKVLPELVHTDKDGYKYVDYISVVPLLVAAVQQLQAEIAGMQDKAPAKQQAVAAGSDIASDMLTPALYQNAPNPFTGETVIRYDLPETVQQAVLYIYDMQGKQIKAIPADGRGAASVTVQGSELQAGMYIYALIADGKEIASKRMILTK